MASVKVWYDRDGDFLEITFDDAAAITDEVAEDIFERRTLDGRIVGFGVPFLAI